MNLREIKNLKGHLVNKNLFYIFICLFSAQLYCQKKIVGRYNHLAESQEHYDYFTFYNNNVFDYNKGASLGDDIYGKGRYIIRNDSLILNYNLTELKKRSYHRFKNYVNSSSSINVQLRVFDLNNNPLSGVNIVGDLKTKYGVITNNDGQASLQFERKNDFKKITVSNLCCLNYAFDINTDKNYVIDVFLSNEFYLSKAIRDNVEHLIIKHNPDSLILRQNNKTKLFVRQR